ncbi:MAG: translation initiation factor IF-3 [Lentisphaeria bacterium]
MARAVGRNDRKLRDRQVRLIDQNDDNIGLVSFDEAIKRAEDAKQDLVEVAGKSNPPVCRIMDYGKFQYEEKKKKREQRKKSHTTKLKEIQFHPNIDEHDYQTKLNHIIDFLKKGCKVKVSVFFRGREMAHKDIGRDLMDRVLNDLGDMASVDTPPRSMGRNILMYITPGEKAKQK